ncbi:2984_t:CDS:2, partial [Funneliformis geosporum]
IEPRKECDFVLYIITKQTLDFYSIAEVVDESNKRPHKTIFCYLEEGFGKHQVKSLKATAKMVEENGAKVFTNLAEVANYLNSEQKMKNLSKKRQIKPKELKVWQTKHLSNINYSYARWWHKELERTSE